jgi:OOP family OmpA-OmpF porin
MNMKFAAVAALGALSLAAVAPQAAAADHGFYVGAGITQSTLKVDFEGDSGSENDNGYKIIAGWRALDWLAVEANYVDLGGVNEDGASIDSNALTVSGLLIAEVGIVDLYARLGMVNWNTDIGVSGLGSTSDDGWEPLYGIGVGLHFGSFGARLEYEQFSSEPFDSFDADTGTITLGATWTFL